MTARACCSTVGASNSARSGKSTPKASRTREITWKNTTRLFQYDPFEHIPQAQCTVGALRAQAKDVDLTPRSGAGGKAPSDYAKGYATVGDIIKQMMGALSTPFDSGAEGKR